MVLRHHEAALHIEAMQCVQLKSWHRGPEEDHTRGPHVATQIAWTSMHVICWWCAPGRSGVHFAHNDVNELFYGVNVEVLILRDLGLGAPLFLLS